MKKKTLLSILAIMILALSFSFVLTACNHDNTDTEKEDIRQYVDIIVTNPVTGETIENNRNTVTEDNKNNPRSIIMPYSDNFQMPEVRLKMTNSGKYLQDEDFTNGSLKSHMQLYIRVDGTYEEQLDCDNYWPKEIGQYEIMIKFNEDGWVGEESINDEKYFRSVFTCILRITAE